MEVRKGFKIIKNMIAIFKVKELKSDFISGVILGLLLIAIIHHFNLGFIFNNLLDSLDAVLTLSATLTGFLITSLTILFVFPENNRIKFVKLHPVYRYVFHAFIVSTTLFVILAILSFCFKILMPYIPAFLVSLLIILLVWAMISLFRCLWLLKRMINVYFYKSDGSQD